MNIRPVAGLEDRCSVRSVRGFVQNLCSSTSDHLQEVWGVLQSWKEIETEGKNKLDNPHFSSWLNEPELRNISSLEKTRANQSLP